MVQTMIAFSLVQIMIAFPTCVTLRGICDETTSCETSEIFVSVLHVARIVRVSLLCNEHTHAGVASRATLPLIARCRIHARMRFQEACMLDVKMASVINFRSRNVIPVLK